MKNIVPAVWAECLKSYRSRTFLLSILVFVFIPCMMGVVLFVVKNPEFASKMGLIGTKAALLRFENSDWQHYFSLLNQMGAGFGLGGFAFVTAWVFGREYADRTVIDILALPISRSSIVVAKFIFVALWCGILSVVFFSSAVVVGGLIQLPGWSDEIAVQNVYLFGITSLLTILLCTPVAFIASYGRGYLAPIGFAILTIIIAQFTGLVGLGPYFPWGIPLLFTSADVNESIQLGIMSYGILVLTSTLGFIGTVAWWRYADQY